MSASSNYQVFKTVGEVNQSSGIIPAVDQGESLTTDFTYTFGSFDKSLYDTFEFLAPSCSVTRADSESGSAIPTYLEISLPYRLVPTDYGSNAKTLVQKQTFPSPLASGIVTENSGGRVGKGRKIRYPNPYAVADHRVINFTEKFLIPFYSADAVLRFEAGMNRGTINALIRYLHFAAGVSYAKTTLPNDLVHQTILSDGEAQFFSSMYQAGLGELAHNNKIDISQKLAFKHRTDVNLIPRAPLPYRPWCSNPILPFGGGKDSCVSFELLKATGSNPIITWVGEHEHIRSTAKTLVGTPSLEIQRILDPQLFQLNEAGAYNGHVPVTGILAFALLVSAAINGSNSVVMSNERSASEPSMVLQSWNSEMSTLETSVKVPVNHQYSKSFEFEKAIQELLETHIVGAPRYYSLLRPLSELQICRLFANYKAYHPLFSSCNRSFTINATPQQANWCGNCAKCAFVYLALAPFVSRAELLAIFGVNLFAQNELSSTFYELCGFDGHKPFECVGEVEEARLAVLLLLKHPEWMQEPMLLKIADRFSTSEQYRAQLEKRYLSVSKEHSMPVSMYDSLTSIIEAKAPSCENKITFALQDSN
jgi:UDP-N-acetyl-alpha-D-muramoyl-L-alanyl-L-glutamate epimerase